MKRRTKGAEEWDATEKWRHMYYWHPGERKRIKRRMNRRDRRQLRQQLREGDYDT